MKPLSKKQWEIVNKSKRCLMCGCSVNRETELCDSCHAKYHSYQGKSPKQVKDSQNMVCLCAGVIVVLTIIFVGYLIFK